MEIEQAEAEKAVHDSNGWALSKDRDRPFSIMAQDADFFIFYSDSNSTILGFETFKKLGERDWLRDEVKTLGFAVRDLLLKFAGMGNVAWDTCSLVDQGKWNGTPIGWDNGCWTGPLEICARTWLIVQMHFSFAKDK